MTSTQCQICSKLLTDPESIKRGYGPDCAEKRAKALSAMGVTDTDLEIWETDPATARWVEVAFKALRRNSSRDARQFFQAARRATLACAT